MKYKVYKNKKCYGLATEEEVKKLIERIEINALSVMAITEKEKTSDGFVIYVKNSCMLYQDFYFKFKECPASI